MMIFSSKNYGKLSAKFLLGTSTVIEKVELLSYFLFLARTTARILLKISVSYKKYHQDVLNQRLFIFEESTWPKTFLELAFLFLYLIVKKVQIRLSLLGNYRLDQAWFAWMRFQNLPFLYCSVFVFRYWVLLIFLINSM